MSENGRTRHQLTHQQCYAACECLKKNKQSFLDARPSAPDAADMLGKLLGVKVSDSAVGDLKAATGIEWQARYNRASSTSIKVNAQRTLTVALYRLYRKLGEEVPESLSALYDEFNDHKPAPTNTQ